MVVALCGGGTLGHVIPALAVVDSLKALDPGLEAFYLGSRKDLERRTVEDYGLTFYPISAGKLRRYFSLENFTDFFRLCHGFFQARRILKARRPDVLFSKGGYVSVPVVLAAASLGIRIVTHESDATLGLANRINALFASTVCLGFDSPLCDGKKYVYTGNPVREDVVRQAGIDVDEEDDLILILGGSQGSAEINSLVYGCLDRLCSRYRVVHQCGRCADLSVKHVNYTQLEFIDEGLASLMARSALVVSRSGAGALSELCTLGKASLLVPLAHASRGDQMENARLMEKRGACVVYRKGDDFASLVLGLMENRERRKKLGEAAASLAKKDAATTLASITLGG